MNKLLSIGINQQAKNLNKKVSLIKYGKLYSWRAASEGTFITNMIIPSKTILDTLYSYMGSGGGNELKHPRKNGTPCLTGYNTSVHPTWAADPTNYGTDTVNFSALPNGYKSNYYTYLGTRFMIWAIPKSSVRYYYGNIKYDYSTFFVDYFTINNYYLGLRCYRAATSGEQSAYSDGDIIEQVEDYDGNIYDCVKIGTQVWTRQNLATTHYTNGNAISGVLDYDDNSSNTFFANKNESIWQ